MTNNFIVGDKVKLKKGSPLYKSSNSIIPSGYVKDDKITFITRVASGTKHPYNTTGDLGWMNGSDIISLEENDDKYEFKGELIDKDELIDYLSKNDEFIIVIDSKQFKEMIK